MRLPQQRLWPPLAAADWYLILPRLLHQGMIVHGVPYSCQELLNMDEISGGTPYGASTLAKGDGSRTPSANELAIARFQGRHVAEISKKLFG